MKEVSLSALVSGRLYPLEISPVLISITSWANPRTKVQPEGLCQQKIPLTPSGTETVTFRLLVQSLNQLRLQENNILREYIYGNCYLRGWDVELLPVYRVSEHLLSTC